MALAGTRVSLYIECAGLADKDTFSKSDPYVVLYNKNITNGNLVSIGRTETIDNSLDPKFQTVLHTDYFFESKQIFVAKIFDNDDAKTDAGNDSLGSVEFLLAHVMAARGHTKTFPIPPPNKGTLTITAVDHSTTGEDTISLSFFGKDLKKMDTFSASDPYFVLHRILPNKQKVQVYQSEVIDNNLNPRWRPLPVLKVSQLMGSVSSEKTIDFECFDKDMFGFKSMGHTLLSVDELLQGATKPNEVFFELKKDHKPGQRYGYVHVSKCDIVKAVSFADLLSMGWQINLAVAIDFTASNGDPRDPRSLHAFNPNGSNQYVHALTSIGEILLDYDSDKNVAAFGFGATLPDGRVSHHFHLNMQPNPYVQGMPGLVDAYQRALASVRLYGPTNFGPTITNTAAGARAAEASQVYTILLIITDGEITDMDETIDALVKADDAPLSIVIVGVGNGCDFSCMNALDGDGAALNSRGRISRRDLVQFVAMRDFLNRPPGDLAAEVLREVPAQVERWAAIRGLRRDANALAKQMQATQQAAAAAAP